MKKLSVLATLAVCASLAGGCRSVPKTPSPPANPPAVVAVADEPVPPPKPVSPASVAVVATPAPLPPTKVAGAPLPRAMSEMEVVRSNIISTRSAIEQVRTDLGEDVEAVAAKLAALEKRVVRAEGFAGVIPASAPAPSASPAVVIDGKAWEGIIRSLTSARPTMAEVHLDRLRQAFSGTDEELLLVLLGKTNDPGIQDWLRKQFGSKPEQ